MNTIDFVGPGFYEYLLQLIGVFSIILAIFMIGVVIIFISSIDEKVKIALLDEKQKKELL